MRTAQALVIYLAALGCASSSPHNQPEISAAEQKVIVVLPREAEVRWIDGQPRKPPIRNELALPAGPHRLRYWLHLKSEGGGLVGKWRVPCETSHDFTAGNYSLTLRMKRTSLSANLQNPDHRVWLHRRGDREELGSTDCQTPG